MARAGFGGSSDYSSLFGSLYNSTKAQAQAQQDASDQDALDRWSNGLMQDTDWLAYIQQRIDATAGDPKQQEKWVTALRKYQPAIGDSQAEQAYNNGGSVNDLIAHYKERLSTLTVDSNGYRDVQTKLNDAMDKRSQDNLQTGADNLNTAISSGKASYDDLLKFLKTQKAQLRPNSALYDSVNKQITQVSDTIKSNAIEGRLQQGQYQYDTGKLSSSGFASLIRQEANNFKTADPKRYYQMLDAATKVNATGGSGGGGGGGGGASTSQKIAYKKNLSSIDALQAQRDNLQAMVKQYENNPTGVVVDPSTGKASVLSPTAVRGLDQQLVKTWDAMSAAYKSKVDSKGRPAPDLSAAAAAQKAKATYVATSVVNHNTIPAAEQSTTLMGAVNSVLDHALQDPDPTHAMFSVQEAASMVNTWTKNLQNTTSTVVGKPTDNPHGLHATTVTPKGPMDQVDPSLISRASTLGQALAALASPDVTDADAQSAMDQITALSGSAPGNTQESALTTMAKKALQINGTRQGLANGDLERVITPKGIQYAQKVNVATNAVVNGQVQTVMQKVADYSPFITDAKTQQQTSVYIDINGQPTKVGAVAVQTQPAGATVWKAKSEIKLADGTLIHAGQIVPSDIVLKNQDVQYKLEAAPAFTYYQVTVPSYSDSNGTHQPTVWSQDPNTNLWYQGALPLRNIQYAPDGTVLVDKNGSAQVDYKAFASEGGVPSPYSGGNAKAMQDIANQGLTDKPNGTRDITGTYNPNGSYDVGGAYYNATTIASAPDQRDSWWNDNAQASKAAKAADAFKANAADAAAEQKANIQSQISKSLASNKPASDLFSNGPLGDILKIFGISPSHDQAKASSTYAPPVTKGGRDLATGEAFDPSSATKVPGAASGPNISPIVGFNLDIKKSDATTITAKAAPKPSAAPKVTAKPVTAPAPGNIDAKTGYNPNLNVGGGRLKNLTERL